MLLIDRYLLRQLLGPTVLATAALAAVADAARVDPAAALDWLVTEPRAETAHAAAPVIGGGLKIEVNGF